MFGSKERQRRRQCGELVSTYIRLEYDFWLSRKPPDGFVYALVECVRGTGVPMFAGQKIAEPSALVDAVYALRAGFTSQQFNEEQRAMAAHALMDLLLQAGPRLAQLAAFERETLMHMGTSLESDPHYREARAYSNPQMLEVVAKAQAARVATSAT